MTVVAAAAAAAVDAHDDYDDEFDYEVAYDNHPDEQVTYTFVQCPATLLTGCHVRLLVRLYKAEMVTPNWNCWYMLFVFGTCNDQFVHISWALQSSHTMAAV